jgi:hypothetical protein
MCSNELAIKILFNHTQTADLLKRRAQKLNNLFHAQSVFRQLNCPDKSFLPRRDKTTTFKLLVYGLTLSLRKPATIINLLRIQTLRDTLILTVKRPSKMRLPIAPTPLPFDVENFPFRANQAAPRPSQHRAQD